MKTGNGKFVEPEAEASFASVNAEPLPAPEPFLPGAPAEVPEEPALPVTPGPVSLGDPFGLPPESLPAPDATPELWEEPRLAVRALRSGMLRYGAGGHLEPVSVGRTWPQPKSLALTQRDAGDVEILDEGAAG